MNQRNYRFGDFELKLGSRVLERRGIPQPLGSKAFEVLTCLVMHAGEVVTKDDLLKHVWPNSFVEEKNLAQQIVSLRKALGDKADYIATIPGRGYQFTEPVQEVAVPSLSPAPESDLVHAMRRRTHVVIEESSPLLLAEKTKTSSRTLLYSSLTVAALAFATWETWRWLHHAGPSEYREIVVADFINTTGDTTFDHTLRRALEIDLEQSPQLDVLSERTAVNTLQMMGRSADTGLVADVAREVCERNNRQVLLTGSISSVGDEYLLTLEATDCSTGKRLSGAKAEAKTKAKVLSALDTVAGRIRSGLGESDRSVEGFAVPIARATTPSLEALKAYSIGAALSAQDKDDAVVIPFYQKAIELDPQFAMAYGALGTLYYNLSQSDLASQNFKKAFALSDHVSAKERLILQAHYYAEGQNDLQQGVKTYQIWAATYPHDFEPVVNLANQYTLFGQYDLAIDAGKSALKLQPDRAISYSVLARALMRAGRYAEAKTIGAQAVQRGRDSSGIHATLLDIACDEHDQEAIARETAWAEKSTDSWYAWYFPFTQASAAAEAGKYTMAEGLFAKAYETTRRQQMSESADGLLVDIAEMQLQFGLPAAARATLSRIHTLDTDEPYIAVLGAKLGDPAAAERYLAKHGKETGQTFTTNYYLPLVKAALAMRQDKPLDAVAALEPAKPYELGDYDVMTQRAEAYLQARQGQMAVAEYKKILANPGVDPPSSLYSLAHLGLARSYVLAGDSTAGRAEYGKFLVLWKDADPDLPVLLAAKAELAKIVR